MSTIAASVSAHCPGCGDLITPGEPVVMVDDEAVHEGCEDAAIVIAETTKRLEKGGESGVV